MPAWAPQATVSFVAVALFVASGSVSGAGAQTQTSMQQIRLSPHESGRLGGTSRQRRAIATPRIAYRGLTVNRRPGALPDDQQDRDDTLVDGPIRYGDIHSFNPAPYASSGQQFPYGFDGIGGSGSDLGISAGQNASIYNRGP